ncbi:LOW QUALITY PROTEIN: killer cell lectin-like receptor subfamily B member 1B allele A [Opisthocomus hoazin]|uniref:LOW QUALITY PROTEIN: killer cell lectin-like receptor subfamily B member 1B allele A n=1 Tax=Opisthocomus hoazin TaxID=30419 RepID=UPI003F536DA2
MAWGGEKRGRRLENTSGWPAHRTRSFATLLRLTSVQMLVLLLADLQPGEELAKPSWRSEKPQKKKNKTPPKPRFADCWIAAGRARGTAGAPLASPAMAGEIIYADLDIGPGKRCRKRPSPPQPGASGCPPWHRAALWAGWTGNLLLGVAVVAMGCVLRPQQSESPGSCKNTTENVGDGNATLGNVCLDLRKALCVSELREAEGCKLCPVNWTLHGTKCYWVANGVRVWSASRDDCGNRGAELLMPGDRDELGYVQEMVQKSSRYFWIGLSVPSGGQGWTWLNGSRLDPSRFQLDGDEGRACGVLKGDSISSESCTSASQWICQKGATQL